LLALADRKILTRNLVASCACGGRGGHQHTQDIFAMDVERAYITEVAYPPQFHREHAPVWLGAVLAALGTKVPEGTSRVYCEIGCGSAFGLLLLAATNPSMTFHGIDINLEHIA